MIDSRAMELINGELDGELSADELKELTGILENSRAAREYRHGLTELDRLLADLPQPEVPAQLHEAITASIELPSPAAQRNKSALPAVFRYGLAASVGLMLAVGIYETSPRAPGNTDLDSMIGTMAPRARLRTLDSHRVDAAGLGADVTLSTDNGVQVLEMRLDSSETTDIDIDLNASGLRFDALAQTAGRLESFYYDNQVLHLRSRGRQRFAVLLGNDAIAKRGATRYIDLAFSRGGSVIARSSLQAD